MVSVVLLTALALQQHAAAGPVPTPQAVAADTGSLRHPNGRVPPVAFAVRASAGSPRVDGRLDDAVWATARPVREFTQQMPNDGEPATERTEVRIAYDAAAVYIGARMFESEPGRIAARLGRRDRDTQSDDFEIFIDSYHDHRTAFFFQVNPLGVRADAVLANDSRRSDSSWDPVWEAATHRDSLGWTVEFRIPLSQLRFPNSRSQVWGVNFVRWIRRNGEVDLWAYSSQTDQGTASFFGHLLGLENLPQPQRLEVMPYAAAIEERLAAGSPGNPFNDGSREVARAGLDLQYGLTSGLTLNATVNPDFGQVEADPAEMNLTAYETYFPERRPFFVEGSSIFSVTSPGGIQTSGPRYFYSRRIGRAPQGSGENRGDSAFTDQPNGTTVLGAAKLSGRTGGWSLGVLEVVTSAEYATVDSAGVRFRDQVEPLTNFGILRASRDFDGGATTLGVTGTAVNRRLGRDRLDFLRSAAYAGAVDYSRRVSRNRYGVFASLGYSCIRGDTLAIQTAQTSSARYFQRPDAGHTEYDPSRTSLAGWSAAVGLSKDEGATTWAFSADAASPGFEINDVGYRSRSDRISPYGLVAHRWTRPGRVFRNAQLYASGSAGWNFDGDRIYTSVGLAAYGELLSYWGLSASLSHALRSVDDGLLRGGPLGVWPSGWAAQFGVASDFRKPLRVNLNANLIADDIGFLRAGVLAEVSFRASPTVSLTVGPQYSVGRTPQQYLSDVEDSTATGTFGRRYLFGDVRQHTLDLTTRLDVTFTPNLALQLYAQPFVATGDYRRFKELRRSRTTDYLVYGEAPGSTLDPLTNPDGSVAAYQLDPDGDGPRASVAVGNPDFSYRSLRGNAVLRWEYRPGSTLFLVWTRDCSAFGASPAFDVGHDLRHLCQGRSDNVFAVKVTYWMSW